MITDLETTPTFEGFIEMALNARLMKLHVGMPATVLSYDPSQSSCSVQPNLKRKDTQGVLRSLPVISNVPVGHLRAGKSIVHVPVAAGSTVYLHFSERSIDSWKKAGGIQSPEDARLHDLSDAVAYPGYYSFADKVTVSDPAALTLMNDKAVVALSASGAIKFTNDKVQAEFTADGKFKFSNGTVELLDLLNQTLQAILDARVNTIFGPQPVVNLATFAIIQTKLAMLKE